MPLATAPTTITTGLSVLSNFYTYFEKSTSLAWVEKAILGASGGKYKVTGDFTISSKTVDDSSALTDNLFNNWANNELNLLKVLGILVEGWILMTWFEVVVT